MRHVSALDTGRVPNSHQTPPKNIPSPHDLHLPQPQLKIRRMDPRPNKTPIHLRLPIQMRHLPQRIQHPRDVPPAEKLLRSMELEIHGAVFGVEVTDRGEAALGVRFYGDEADAGEDGHFGRWVCEGRGLAAEDLDVGVVG